MRLKPKHPNNNQSRAGGVTLIELLMVVSVLLMIAWFALPSLDTVTLRAEMTAAAENTRYSIESARKLARRTDSRVILSISGTSESDGQRITFRRLQDDPVNATHQYRLPDSVSLYAGQNEFTFDRLGMADHPGHMMLVSTGDEQITETIPVN